jgi:hypothetical protein
MAKKITTTIDEKIVEQLKEYGMSCHRGFYKKIMEDALLEQLDKVQRFEQLKKETRDFRDRVSIELGLLNEKVSELVVMKDNISKMSDRLELHHRLINKHIVEQV